MEKSMSKDIVKREKDIKDEGKQWPQVLAIWIASLTSLCSGCTFAWTSPSLPAIVNSDDYDITEEEATWFTVIPPIAMMISTPIISKLNDVIGRKKMLLAIGILHIINWILVCFSRSIYVFYMARFVVGLADACVFSALPMYIGEISTPVVRGRWGNILTFNIYFGQFAINVLGSYLSIAQVSYISICFPILFVIMFPFMPESPYFYAMKSRYDDARNSLKWFSRKEDIEPDFLILKSDVERQLSEAGTWKELFTIRSNRKALSAGLFLRIVQQLGGISVFATYTQLIFNKAGGNMSPQLSSIIFTGFIMLLNFVAGFTLDLMGRKKAFMYSSLSSGIVLFCLSIYFYLDKYESQIDLTSLQWIPLTGMILFVLCYSFGLGIVPTLMLGELFSASIKVKGLCSLTIVFGVLISTITKLFYVLDTNFGLFCPFLLFSFSCIVGSVLTIYFVPETKGKTLEEIQQALKAKK
ncbi:facilitated trehalose transporter Tret1 [Aethina tumida]|uniref:facilitated trehalose transporter Tret1 n=1 Tax=Aethina tumida TaxID=116153 RepID=UPI00096ADE0D|nr:facilitated trehalose transporter Tret1 [Aethina tumida]